MFKFNRNCSTCKYWTPSIDNGMCNKYGKNTEYYFKCYSYKFVLKLFNKYGYNLK